MAGGKQFAPQVLAVFDSDLFAKMGLAALGGGEGALILYARHGVRCTSLAPAGSRALKRSLGGVVTWKRHDGVLEPDGDRTFCGYPRDQGGREIYTGQHREVVD